MWPALLLARDKQTDGEDAAAAAATPVQSAPTATETAADQVNIFA